MTQKGCLFDFMGSHETGWDFGRDHQNIQIRQVIADEKTTSTALQIFRSLKFDFNVENQKHQLGKEMKYLRADLSAPPSATHGQPTDRTRCEKKQYTTKNENESDGREKLVDHD
jgi:hypothetical protein